MANQEKFDLIVRARDEATTVINSITGSVGKMMLGFASVAAAGAFLKSSIAAAAESQRIWAQLGATIERHGGSWREAEAGVRSFATNLMLKTGESDEAIASSIKTFIDYGASGAQAFDRVSLAIDIARSKNMDLETVTQALARAQIGYTRGLVQLGLKLDESKDSAIGFADAMRQLRDQHGGAATEEMKTYAGQVRLLAEEWGEFKELIGGPMIGALSGLVSGMNDLAVVVNSNITLLQKLSILVPAITSGPQGVMGLAGASAIVRSEMGALKGEISGVGEVLGPNIVEFDRSKEVLKEWADAAEKATAKSKQLYASWMETRNQMLEGMAPWEGMGGVFRFAEPQPEEFGPTTAELFRSRGMLSDEALDETRRREEELANIMASGSMDAAEQILAIFLGLRADLAEVFKGMALDFARFFARSIVETLAMKAAHWLLGGFGIASASAGGGALATGTDLKGRSRGGMNYIPGGIMAPASVVLQINGDIIGDEHHVRTKIIPAIERAAALNATRIALAR